MATAIEIEQIAGTPAGEDVFRMFVLDTADLVVHAADGGVKPSGFTEAELTRSLTGERGLSAHDAHLLIADARARFALKSGY